MKRNDITRQRYPYKMSFKEFVIAVKSNLDIFEEYRDDGEERLIEEWYKLFCEFGDIRDLENE